MLNARIPSHQRPRGAESVPYWIGCPNVGISVGLSVKFLPSSVDAAKRTADCYTWNGGEPVEERVMVLPQLG